jgi:hypothetical protein|tara:strand:- start:117 stop:263 length:147 start_codon:yes stop_codon:yes gene_type:complete
MKTEISIELDEEDLKDKKLAAYVAKLLAKKAKEKKKSMMDEMPEEEED